MAKAKAEAIANPRPLKNNGACERCPLHERSQTVCCPSVGPKKAELFLVGEALGANEEELGRPFVGDAGFKLNYCLNRAGIKRKTLRIGNCVRCRPPGNKTPNRKQLDACWPYLLHDILLTKPKVIVAMGATATNQLLQGPRISVDEWRGFPRMQTFRYESPSGRVFEHSCWVVPTFHPSACLHDWRYDDLLVRDLEAAKAIAETGQNFYEYPRTKVNVVKTLPEVIKLLGHLKKLERFVLDLETTGLDPHSSRILCIGICYKSGEAHVIPLRVQGDKPFWKGSEFARIVEELTELLLEAKLIGQNIKFDIKHLRRLTGISHYRISFDTMNAHHCIDENKPHNLTFMAQWFLRWDKYDAAMKPYEGNFAAAPNELLWRYCGYDVDSTWQIRRKLIPLLKQDRVVKAFNIELGLTNVLADCEYRGIKLDRRKMDALSVQYRQDIAKAERKLQRIAERRLSEAQLKKCKGRGSKGKVGQFNPNSTQQLSMLLTAAGASLRKTTKSGNISVDKFVLASLTLAKGVPGTIARSVSEVRKLTKYIGTYLDGTDGDGGFKQWLGSGDRIHTNFNVARARTGRLTADDPPMQTLPRTGGLRGMFLPDNPAHVFLSVDYSKIELCVMAWLANDEVMARELINQVDLHSRMAITKRLNRDPTDEEFEKLLPTVEKQERALAKGVNFGIPYGISEYAIVEQNPDAFPIKMTKQERKQVVKAIIDAYFNKYWGVYEFREKLIRLVHKHGWLRTYPSQVGRLRRLTGIDWFDGKYGMETTHREIDLGHLEREALNFPVQSLASDHLSMATKRCYDGIRAVKMPNFRIVLTLHDQLVFNCHRDRVEEAIPLIKGWMETRLPRDRKHRYEMPLRVDVAVQRFWGEAEYE